MDPRQLREERARLIGQARQLLEGAETANRDLTQEEQNQWNALMSQADNLLQRAQRIERQAELDAELGQSQHTPVHTQTPPAPGEQRTGQPGEEQRQAAFQRYLRSGYRTLTEADLRALQVNLDESGGYITMPGQMSSEIIRFVNNAVYIRQWGTPNDVSQAESLGVPTLETDPDDADWTSELATGNEDSAMKFGKRELHPHPLAKRIKISRKLLRLSPNAMTLVQERLGYKFQVAWEKAAMTGNGSQQPLGVFVASSLGISTGRDFSTGNTTTEIKADGLIEAKYGLKPQYWAKARWLFHRDGVKQIAKLKDGNGQYLWRESVRAGEPDRLLNLPIFLSEYAPNTFTTGKYVGILGDFSFYWYADALKFDLQRLEELYAETNQVGLIGRWESDGMPVLEEAFVRVKLA